MKARGEEDLRMVSVMLPALSSPVKGSVLWKESRREINEKIPSER